jgi:hypothetical protein
VAENLSVALALAAAGLLVFPAEISPNGDGWRKKPLIRNWQALATSAGGGTNKDDNDSVQAFEFTDREPVAASQALQLNGNITALWTARNGDSATAVFRDSETGSYEAVQLTLTCGQ